MAAGDGTGERGKEKKHHLLAYLHKHPEELRPVSRKLLNTATRLTDDPLNAARDL